MFFISANYLGGSKMLNSIIQVICMVVIFGSGWLSGYYYGRYVQYKRSIAAFKRWLEIERMEGSSKKVDLLAKSRFN
jgi:hypothetical protein